MTKETYLRKGTQLVLKGRTPLDSTVDNFVLGTTEPTWANSGCRVDQASLTTNTTVNLVTTADGQVISGLYLPNGRIEVRHKNVIIRDCIIKVGYAPNGSGAGQRLFVQNNCGIIHNPNFITTGNLIEYVTIDPVNGADPATSGITGARDAWGNDAQTSGVFGYGFTARRNAIRHVTDGFMPDVRSGMMSPALIEGNYIETRYLSYDAEQSDGTHNDSVQLAGGDGNVIRGNALVNPSATNSNGVKGQCVVLTPYHGAIDNTIIEYNWMYGAYTQVSAWVASTYGPQPLGLTTRNNRHMGQCVWMILITPAVNTAKTDISGNVVGAGGINWNNGFTAAGQPANVNVASAG